jgi:hypothetical protein
MNEIKEAGTGRNGQGRCRRQDMNRQEEVDVRQESALDRQESRKGWERTGMYRRFLGRKGHEREGDRQTRAGGGKETGCDFGKERFL